MADLIEWHGKEPPGLSPPARRAVDVACRYYDDQFDEKTGMVLGDQIPSPDPRSTFLCAIALLLSDRPGRRSRARSLMERLEGHFDVPLSLLLLFTADPLLDEDLKGELRESIRGSLNWGGEDIIAGRNINIPLGTWTGRIAAGNMFGEPDFVRSGAGALERLLELVREHGTIPEFNSPTYHPITLMLLRLICLAGDDLTSSLAARLESHLWREMAWRWHPRLRQLCGPWGRAYLDSLYGGSGLVLMLADLVWGAFYDEGVAGRFRHGHDWAFGGAMVLLAHGHPASAYGSVALNKDYPLTIINSAEQVAFQFGDGDRSTWTPGGVADLTTWIDENIAIGTSSRPHIHNLQGACYVAQWSRTGGVVEKLGDLGQAYTKYVQNGRLPGDCVDHLNHHLGGVYRSRPCLWPESGMAYTLQSGPTALVTYVPKAQERWTVRRLEGVMVFPRLNTIDGVMVDGEEVSSYLGPPGVAVMVRSGRVSLGMRMGCCDQELCEPRAFVEESRDHLLVGLRVADFEGESELPEHVYRRYGTSIGAEVRWTPTDGEVEGMLKDLDRSDLSDGWPMGIYGGHREVSFSMGGALLHGRLDPVSGTWLGREVPDPGGRVVRIALQ